MDKLIAWADVLAENFKPRVLERLGYGYEYCKKINPKIIVQTQVLVILGHGPKTGKSAALLIQFLKPSVVPLLQVAVARHTHQYQHLGDLLIKLED